MTGFATAEEAVPPFRVVWELRGVNHRFLEIGLRLPDELRGLEAECRERIGAVAKRGKVDATLKVLGAEGSAAPLRVSADVVAALASLEAEVRRHFPDARAPTTVDILRWPGVLEEPEQRAEALEPPAKRTIAAALAAFADARRREGERLGELLEKRNAAILALLAEVRPLLAGAQLRHRDKLRDRLARLDVQADPERLEQELALLVQRLDVAEEVDRLVGHVAEVRAALAQAEPIGRRLDFLIQELHREANTFASKVQDETLTRAAVELKVLIEQMREQVQNLE